MALSANKHRAKEMKRLGWVWWPHMNAWVWLGHWDNVLFAVQYRPAGWTAVDCRDHEVDVGTEFDSPIAAAIWISVEYADEIAADKERASRGWEDHLRYSLPA